MRRGFGFITRIDDAQDCFVHYTALKDKDVRDLIQGQTVSFWISKRPKGPEAHDVHLYRPESA
jgi:cold shock CspA family protein